MPEGSVARAMEKVSRPSERFYTVIVGNAEAGFFVALV